MSKLIEQALEEIHDGHPTAHRVLEEFYRSNMNPADIWERCPTFNGGTVFNRHRGISLAIKGYGVRDLFNSMGGSNEVSAGTIIINGKQFDLNNMFLVQTSEHEVKFVIEAIGE